MFDLADKTAVIGLVTDEEHYKDLEMEVFGLEYDHEPLAKLIMIWIELGKAYAYKPEQEHDKWHYITA